MQKTITTLIPQYGELNRICKDWIVSHTFSFGKGEFQVDGTVFPVEEGSVVRVSPAGKRSVRNNGTTPLLMLCIQYCSNTFSQEDATDGIILKEPVKWKVSPK